MGEKEKKNEEIRKKKRKRERDDGNRDVLELTFFPELERKKSIVSGEDI